LGKDALAPLRPRQTATSRLRLPDEFPLRKGGSAVSDLEEEIKALLSGHRLSQNQLQALQQGESDAEIVRSLQRMLANTQNALLRLAREIDELRTR
jgi:hypothetical protein